LLAKLYTSVAGLNIATISLLQDMHYTAMSISKIKRQREKARCGYVYVCNQLIFKLTLH
jgi:hypothetical protein